MTVDGLGSVEDDVVASKPANERTAEVASTMSDSCLLIDPFEIEIILRCTRFDEVPSNKKKSDEGHLELVIQSGRRLKVLSMMMVLVLLLLL